MPLIDKPVKSAMFFLKKERTAKYKSSATSDVFFGDVGAHAPNIFDIARKLVKNPPSCKELATVFSVTFFLVAVIGQMVKTPPPPLK